MDSGDKIRMFFIFFAILALILIFILFIGNSTPTTTPATTPTATPAITPDAFQQLLNLFKATTPPPTTHPPTTTSASGTGNQTTTPPTTSASGNGTGNQTTAPPSATKNVVLYTDINAGGTTVKIPIETVSLQSPNLGIPGKSLKGIQIPTGYKVVLFDSVNYTGYCVILTSSVLDLSTVNFLSKTLSLKIYDDKTAVDKSCLFTFWTDSNFSGNSFTFMGSKDPTVVVSVPNLLESNPTLNNAISSIEMPNNIPENGVQKAISFQLVLYANANFSGIAAALSVENTTELSNLSYMSKLTSSFRIDNTSTVESAVGCFRDCVENTSAICYLTLGDYNMGDLLANGLEANDTISKITVPSGLVATIYADPDYRGYSFMIKAGNVQCLDNLNGWNFKNTTSSIRITKDTDPRNNVIIYNNSNYPNNGGKDLQFEFGNGSYDIKNLNELNFNDNIGSLKIPNGKKVVLFSDPGFTGQAVVLTKDNADLGKVSDNQYNNINMFKQTSSLIVLNANDEIPVPFATWYTDINYNGVCASWGKGWAGGQNNKPSGIPDKSVSSIRVSPHTKVTVYMCGRPAGTGDGSCDYQMYITQSINDATNQNFNNLAEKINDNAIRFYVESN